MLVVGLTFVLSCGAVSSVDAQDDVPASTPPPPPIGTGKPVDDTRVVQRILDQVARIRQTASSRFSTGFSPSASESVAETARKAAKGANMYGIFGANRKLPDGALLFDGNRRGVSLSESRTGTSFFGLGGGRQSSPDADSDVTTARASADGGPPGESGSRTSLLQRSRASGARVSDNTYPRPSTLMPSDVTMMRQSPPPPITRWSPQSNS